MAILPAPKIAMLLRTVLASAVLATFGSFALGDEPPSFETLVRRLGDDDFATREKASAELLRRGEAVHAALGKVVESTKDPEIKTRAADIMRRIEDARRVADELHLIGISRAKKDDRPLIPRDEEILWTPFCEQVVKESQSKEPNPSKRIWDFLPDDVRRDFQDPEHVAAVDRTIWRREGEPPPPPPPETKGRLWTWRRAMDQVFSGPDLYDPKLFQAVAKSPAVRDYVERRDRLTPLEKRLFHRKLFDLAYPTSVTPCGVEIADLSVNVHVRPGTTSVNLAVCSYSAVRWVVHDPDRRVKNVIVGGYEVSDATGTNAPIAYYAYQRRENGLASVEGHFQTCHVDDKSYPAAEEKLRRITGMKITKFHGAAYGNSFEIGE